MTSTPSRDAAGRRPVPPRRRLTAPLRALVQQPLVPDRPVRRVTQLLWGLVLFGVSDAMVIIAGLGVEPWDALSQGLSRTVGLGIGMWTNILGALVLLLWIPLRTKPGLGTLCNVLLVGTSMEVVLLTVPTPDVTWQRWTLLLTGVLLNGVATGAYIGAGLGPGPRDGLMTGWAARGHSIRGVRWVIELSVLAAGFLLGATLGVGTVLYALAIGPLAQFFLPRLEVAPPPRREAPQAAPAE